LCAELDRRTSSTLEIKKTLNGLLARGAFGPEGFTVVNHDTKAEEHQVTVPQHALAQFPERNQSVPASESDAYQEVVDHHLED
jgi:hypothetical protein